jgi:hypothetical protein
MMAWTPPAAWAAAALAAVWLRGFFDHGQVHGGLTITALACAIAAAFCVLDLASGRRSKRG